MNEKNKRGWIKAAIILAILFAIGIIVVQGVKTYTNNMNPRTVVITGTGKVAAVPDVSTISFTLRSESKNDNTKTLQEDISKKADSVFAKLKELGIDEKDIKTTNYSVNPKYGYRDCYSASSIQPCESRYVLGYEASESVDVKVRSTENVSKVLDVLAGDKITEVYGPNFSIDDVEAVKDSARDLAIQDAKDKASVLAKSLGVKIKRIVSFSDNNGVAAPYPAVYRDSMNYAAGAVELQSAKVANIAEGQQDVVSNVSITFQIED
ncbi:26 kDa periplasmic immunogenic protein [bioreactor metagenome]|uniref:26 kDa periplasmic immunogenic protein n=1 Tax=bioreactor metagenome TaxID=1076179 RepID=A0A644UA28_9ZZZZ|nr:SIMPL domain-containing protein [Candidatus Elulimicrobiales bacterium]